MIVAVIIVSLLLSTPLIMYTKYDRPQDYLPNFIKVGIAYLHTQKECVVLVVNTIVDQQNMGTWNALAFMTFKDTDGLNFKL